MNPYFPYGGLPPPQPNFYNPYQQFPNSMLQRTAGNVLGGMQIPNVNQIPQTKNKKKKKKKRKVKRSKNPDLDIFRKGIIIEEIEVDEKGREIGKSYKYIYNKIKKQKNMVFLL